MKEIKKIETDSITVAKQFLKENWKEGVICPCCNQVVKLYQRKIYATMAILLIALYKQTHPKYDFIHINEFRGNNGTGDFAKLRYWEMINEKPNDDNPDKRTSGYWSITQKGIDFITNRIIVPKYVLLYDSRVFGFSDDKISIEQALGKKFKYTELMDGVPVGAITPPPFLSKESNEVNASHGASQASQKGNQLDLNIPKMQE